MRNNYREDGFVWFEDQISEMADLLITVQGIRYIYLKRRDRSWIERIGDEGMRFALMNMTEIQLRMIEELIFEDKTVTDIRRELNLTITEIRMEMFCCEQRAVVNSSQLDKYCCTLPNDIMKQITRGCRLAERGAKIKCRKAKK